MKQNFVWAVLLGAALVFSSCDKLDTVPTEDATLTEFVLAAVSGNATAIGANGRKHCNLTEVDPASLPEAITAYVSTNYAGATIERAGTTDQGTYMVHIRQTDGTATGLLFNADGTFVSAQNHKGGHGTPVSVEALPAAVTTYLTENYPGATIAKAVVETSGNYLVALKKADGTMVGAAFDANGAFTNEVALNGKFGKHGKKRKGSQS